MLRRFFLTTLAATPIAACLPTANDRPTLSEPTLAAEYVGRWVEVLLGSDGGGFELFESGRAASINQPDITYVSWRTEPNKLFLTTAQTTGDSSKTTETEYLAKQSTPNSLHLSKGGKDDWPRVFRMID